MAKRFVRGGECQPQLFFDVGASAAPEPGGGGGGDDDETRIKTVKLVVEDDLLVYKYILVFLFGLIIGVFSKRADTGKARSV